MEAAAGSVVTATRAACAAVAALVRGRCPDASRLPEGGGHALQEDHLPLSVLLLPLMLNPSGHWQCCYWHRAYH